MNKKLSVKPRSRTLKVLPLEYSGVRSRKFWDRISALPMGKDRHYLYTMGCNLQDIEARTIGSLNRAIIRLKSKP